MPKAAKPDEFDMGDETEPTEFSDEGGNTASKSTGTADFAAMGFHKADEEASRRRLYPPTGDWVKTDTWKFDYSYRDDDNAPGDFNSEGRLVYNFSGQPDPRLNKEGDEFCPMLFLRVSPDKRYKQDKPTEFDTAYKLYLQAKDLYLELKGEVPENQLQLIDMLIEDSYTLRTFNGDSGPIISDAKPIRKRR